MPCLPEHPHALVTGDVVTNVAVFAGHDQELIDQVREANGADTAVCCCEYGSVPGLGDTWDGTTFFPPAPPA